MNVSIYSSICFIVCLTMDMLLLCSDHPGLLVCGRGQAGAAHHEGSRADGGAEVQPGPAELVAAHAG